MEIIKLKTRQRTGAGKSYTRKTRVEGWVPAIYYGHNRESVAIEIDATEFAALVRHKNTTHLIDLGIGSSQGESIAVIKEIQRHVLKKDKFLHIDFQHVAMDEKVTVRVPLELKGIPVGVKENHGILDHHVKAIMVECMPMNIPEKVTIDVSSLQIGESIHAREVNIPDLTIKESPDEVFAVVTHPTREETTSTGEAEEEAAEVAAPAKGKK